MSHADFLLYNFFQALVFSFLIVRYLNYNYFVLERNCLIHALIFLMTFSDLEKTIFTQIIKKN